MILCLVTDRRRLSPDACSFEETRRALGRLIREAVGAGVDLIQIRERDLEARDLATLVEDAVRLSRGTGTRVLVNDRQDVAMACGAHGVHLRSDSVSAADVRGIASAGWLVGRSVHNVEQATSAGAVDFLMAGTVFPPAKFGHAVLGLDGFRDLVAATRAPVLAIGGVTLDRLEEVAAAGAAGVAAIGMFIGSSSLSLLVNAARRFDGVRSGFRR